MVCKSVERTYDESEFAFNDDITNGSELRELVSKLILLDVCGQTPNINLRVFRCSL